MFRLLSGTIKVLFLFVVLAALGTAILYARYSDRIYDEIRTGLETELSKTFDGKVEIESLGYRPPLSAVINGIEITPNDPQDEKTSIERLVITIDPFAFLQEKRLAAVIDIRGLRKEDIVWHAQIKTTSRQAEDHLKALDPSLLESVSILEAELKLGRLKVENIFGTLDIKNGKVTGGKIDFNYRQKYYFLVFRTMDKNFKRYDLSFRSDNLSVSCRIAKESGTAIIESLKGMFYTLKFDLKGELKNPTSSKSQLTMNGMVDTSLEGVSSLPEGLGKFGREHRLSGMIKSTVFLKAAEPDISMLEVNGTLFANNLRFDEMKLQELTTKWTVKNGRFNAPMINATIYGGRLNGRLTVDIGEDYLPYRTEFKLALMDFGAMLYDATKKKVSVYGTMDMDISLSGKGLIPDSVEGFGSVKIYDAGLGPMPIVTPLLGNIFSAIETYFPEKYKVNINYMKTGFEVKDRKVETSSLTFGGKTFSVKAEGYMDFNGVIDFALQNELCEPPADEFAGWQISLRHAVSEMGRNLGRARVRGTLDCPKWDFEFTPAD